MAEGTVPKVPVNKKTEEKEESAISEINSDSDTDVLDSDTDNGVEDEREEVINRNFDRFTGEKYR